MKSKTKYLWKREVTDTITGKTTVENIEVDPFDVVNEDGRSLGDLLHQVIDEQKKQAGKIERLEKEIKKLTDQSASIAKLAVVTAERGVSEL